MPYKLAFQEIIGTLEYWDQERQNRTGAMRGAAGLEANALNKAAVGTTMAMQSMASQRIEHIARMMAPAVESLFSAVWEVISKHASKSLTIKLNGQWTTVDPQAWRTKRDIRISVGVGAGNKEQMQQALMMMFGAQLQTMPLGLAGKPELHATVTEVAKLAGFANPKRFWADPQKAGPAMPNPEAQKTQAQMQIKQMELQADAQKFQAETQNRLREMQMQHEAKLRELQANLELQASNDARDAERENQRAAMETQMQAAEAQFKAQLEQEKLALDKYKADLDAQVKLAIAEKAAPPPVDIAPIQQGIQGLIEYMQAPAEIVRDETGKAIGVKKGDVTRTIKRGADGRAIGVQ
jgi:hypothetical protein